MNPSKKAKPNSSNKPDIRKLKPRGRNISWVSIAITVAVSMLFFSVVAFITDIQGRGEEVALSEVISVIESGDYENAVYSNSTVTIEEKDGDKKYAYLGGTDIYERLNDAGISPAEADLEYDPPLNIDIGSIVSIILLGAGLVLVYMMVRSMQASGGKLMDFGQSKAKMLFGKKTGISFDDVAGIDEVKEELVEIVDFLRNPKKYLAIGARIPRGVLLVGAPGTGKTLLARAVAGEAGVPFFHTSGSEFEEMLVGAGASRVRDLFAKAKKAAPSIIFIDEIDAVAKKRGTVLHSGNGEQTLNQILVEMDGLEDRENVIVIAATNRPDVLDPAILRPGRFDRSVTVEMPDYDGRNAIIAVHAKNKKFAEDVELDLIAKKTIGYSGADLENLLNEAAIMAAKDDRKLISQSDLLEAYLKVKLGRQKKNKTTDKDLKRIAYHEAGHAVVAKLTPNSDPVEKISILSRGSSGGVTVYTPEDDRRLTKKSHLLARLNSLVGGKIAEEMFTGEMTTGASSDIKMATEIARSMVQNYGMSEKLGFVKYGNMEDASYLGYQYGGGREFSENTAQLIDEEVKRLLDEAQANARKILDEHNAVVEELVEVLLKDEEIDRAEFDALFKKVDPLEKSDKSGQSTDAVDTD